MQLNIGFVLLILFGVSLLASSIGFIKYVYFLSIGYGFSIACCGIGIIIIYSVQKSVTITGLIAAILFIIYGFRLSFFLLKREIKSASYKRVFNDVLKANKPIPLFVSLMIWISVSILYVLQVCGVAFTLQNKSNSSFIDFEVIEIIGLAIMLVGVVIESFADMQKNYYKKIDSTKPVMKGLYKICRCPNYYGEILFWTGVVVFSVLNLTQWYEFVCVILGYICIVYIMFNGAQRLEKRQDEKYGQIEEYKKYIKKTPILIYLFIPIKD